MLLPNSEPSIDQTYILEVQSKTEMDSASKTIFFLMEIRTTMDFDILNHFKIDIVIVLMNVILYSKMIVKYNYL